MREETKLALLVAVFLAAYFLPIESTRVQGAFLEGLFLLRDYARQHVLLCLVPAFFIAGAISHFVRQGAVMRYLGATVAPAVLIDGRVVVAGRVATIAELKAILAAWPAG